MRRWICQAVIGLTVACSISMFTAAAEVEKTEVPGIRNFTQIDDNSGFGGALVGFGGATQPAAMAFLQNAGFTTVINLRLDSEENVAIDDSRAAAEAAGLKYVHLPFDTEHPNQATVESFLSIIENPANQPVYIHCNSATRAAALWMIARVMKDGWQLDEASREAEKIALKPPAAIAFASGYVASYGE